MVAAKITFYGVCREALEFYTKVFEGEVEKLETFEANQKRFPTGMPDHCKELIYTAVFTIKDEKDNCHICMGDSPILAITGMQEAGICKDNLAFDIVMKDPERIRDIYNKLMDHSGKSNILLKENEEFLLYGSMIDCYGICWTLYCYR